MKTIKYIMICLNLVVVYFIASGAYGYFTAFNPERKESWLLATGFWLALFGVLNLFWLSIIWTRRIRGGPGAGEKPPNSLKSLEGDPGIEPGNYIGITTT